MALKINNTAINLQAIQVLVARQMGKEFYSTPIKNRDGSYREFDGERLYAVVGTVEPGQKVKLRALSGEEGEVPVEGATCSFVMKETDLETLNGLQGNAFVFNAWAIVNVNVRPQTDTGEDSKIFGSLWVEPDFNKEIEVAPAPARAAAESLEQIMAAVQAGQNRSSQRRLEIATQRAAQLAAPREQLNSDTPEQIHDR